VNKMDLAPYLPISPRRLLDGIVMINASAAVFPMSCLTREGLDAWLDWMRASLRAKRASAAA